MASKCLLVPQMVPGLCKGKAASLTSLFSQLPCSEEAGMCFTPLSLCLVFFFHCIKLLGVLGGSRRVCDTAEKNPAISLLLLWARDSYS